MMPLATKGTWPVKEGLKPLIIGLDLAQVQDFTGLCVLEMTGQSPAHYDLNFIKRFSDRPSYEAIADFVLAMTERDEVKTCRTAPNKVLSRPWRLVVDATGVGTPVVEMLKRRDLDPVAVTITGGHEITRVSASEFRVPKKNLVSTVQLLLNSQRLNISPHLPDSHLLDDELHKFQIRKTASGAAQYEAPWREGEHDDLVLATALAAWYGETQANVQRKSGPKGPLKYGRIAGGMVK